MKNAPFNGKPWSYPESTKLLKACGDRSIPRTEWMAIAASLGGTRTVAACKQQLAKLRALDRRKKNQVKADARRAEMQAPPAPHALPQHASLTAAIFGDPLPGRSALDQRRSA